ncbi:lipoxygenase [Astrocystis sublimbata]|nr:lipoxygenase [Astrocystis sublimbata]
MNSSPNHSLNPKPRNPNPQLLPLTIKTNIGANLTYTPLDNLPPGSLARRSRDRAPGSAAPHRMSAYHAVTALLDRLMHQAYAIRPVGEAVLFNDGGIFDRIFALTNQAVRLFATHFYASAGSFAGNYFFTELKKRGLVECDYGAAAEIAHFAFWEDGERILRVIRNFATSFVDA